MTPLVGTGRLAALQDAMAPTCDALLVTNLTNIRYLSGFTGSAGRLLVLPDSAILLTDGRYAIQAPAQIAAHHVDIDVSPDFAHRNEVFGDAVRRATRLGLEANDITWAEQQELAALLPTHELIVANGLVESQREVKDEAEIERIRQAAHIADQALAAVVERLVPGVSERTIAHQLEAAMAEYGATGPAYETIVASGPNAALPHARPTERLLEAGDLLVIDVGAVVDGYRSDMTRTFFIGEPSATQVEMYAVVEAAQAAGVARVVPGVPTASIDEACRSSITEAGWGAAFVHGTGHGVGLDIHEAPAVAATVAATLLPGHVITVEPGVYSAEHGGVRIEDLVLVTDTGAQVLTGSPKTPHCGPRSA